MVLASNLGYPRIGPKRQLKTALESYWNGKISEEELLKTGRELRRAAWELQKAEEIDFIPSNDFSLYDHVLDTIAMVGAVPKRFRWSGGDVDLNTYFLMARGAVRNPAASLSSEANQSERAYDSNLEVPAMEMTKWFNTNYHFIVPELEDGMRFKLSSRKCIDEYLEAKAIGIETRPVLLGPLTFLHLAKGLHVAQDEKLLESLVSVYKEVLSELKAAGATWVQIDEPCLSTDLKESAVAAFHSAYSTLAESGLSIMLTTYFAAMDHNLSIALSLPVQGIHVDLLNGKSDLASLLDKLPIGMMFSAGVVDGHNVWRNDLQQTIDLVGDIAEQIGPDRLIIAPSCSLLHVPIDLELESVIKPHVKPLLAFARQKLRELAVITDGLTCGLEEIKIALSESNEVVAHNHARNDAALEQRLSQVTPAMRTRETPFAERYKLQRSEFKLPYLPTTSIGSFPQTKEIREARKNFRAGKIDKGQYETAMKEEISNNIELQEKIGLDVLVHGEPERTDMVEYFAESLEGMIVTQHGWVQSYGSRYVKPPIIFGAVTRPTPMTVEWAKYAQSLTDKPVKGMLTGPVTILMWSFVRDDQPREKTCAEIALAIRDEVVDLEAAGIKIIQIDEPAIREGLPLKRAEWSDYVRWSVECFRLSASGVTDATQIHTHMCYSEFGDMVQAIVDMDADVISIEAARSSMDLLKTLKTIQYPNAIGPGVYDIHSPRVPSEEEIEQQLRRVLQVIPVTRLWVNPDCGLKTRSWAETIPALNAMVQATVRLRSDIVVRR